MAAGVFASTAPMSSSLAMLTSLEMNCVFVTLVLVNVAVFVFSNGSTGTWVRVWLRLRSDEDDHPPYEANIFTLGTFSTIKDFWKSGAKVTAVLTGITSGGLPYFLLVIALALWFVPLGATKRGIAAGFLLQAVRFEHMLTLAAILLCVALKTDVPLSDLAHLKLRTIFGWGTFAFEIGNLFSYAIVVLLNAVHKSRKDDEKAVDDAALAMASAGAEPPQLQFEGRKILAARLGETWKAVAFGFLTVLNVALVVTGVTVPAIRFTVREIATLVVQTTRREFSVLKIIEAFNGSTRRAESKGVWCSWLGILCMGVPIIAAVFLFVLVCVPMGRTSRTRLFIAALHCHALASADVVFIVIANFATEVAIISDWIINEQAKYVCDAIHDYTKYDGCMKVTGFTLPGFWCLGASTILQNLLYFLLYLVVFRDSLYPGVQAYVPDLLLLNDDRGSRISSGDIITRNPLTDVDANDDCAITLLETSSTSLSPRRAEDPTADP